MAFFNTLNATCPIPSLLHGKTNSLAPPAALTPLTPLNTPLKNNYHDPKTASPDEATFASLLCFSYWMDSWQETQQAGRENWLLSTLAGALPLSYSWSTAAKAAKPPLASSLQLPFPINFAPYTSKTFLHFPFSLQCQKMGKSEQSFFKRDTEVWLSGVLEGITEEVGSGDGRRGVSWKGPTGSPCPGQLHAAQQQGQESPSGHCRLSPLQSHTHRHTHPHIVWPMKGCTGALGMPSVTQYV